MLLSHLSYCFNELIPIILLQIDGVVGFSSAPEDRVVGGGEYSFAYSMGIFILYIGLIRYIYICTIPVRL